MKLKSLLKIVLIAITVTLSNVSYAQTIWIDVRSSVEHAISNIEADARISAADIVQEVSRLYPDKNTEIHLYCAAGGRAGQAKSSLEEAGYTNVVNAGGIDDARKERGIQD